MSRRLPAVRLVLLALAAWLQTGYAWYLMQDGTPLRWYCDEIPVFWDQALCADVSAEDAEAAIRNSLQAWNGVECPHPRLVEGGAVQGVPPFEGSPPKQTGNNLLIFEDDTAWAVGDGKTPGVIALTTILYDTRTGAVGSFAMEFNDGAFRFGTDGNPRDMDLQNTMTHELGHVLALDHSTEDCQRPIGAPTMCFSAPSGETAKRTLEQDDRKGLCSLYQQRWNDEATCGSEEDDSSGGCSATSRSTGPWPLLSAAALLLSWWRRRWHSAPHGDSLARFR